MKTRRYFKNLYPVNPEEEAILKKVYKEPYLEFKDLPVFMATNSCSIQANNLLLFMENTPVLYEEMTALQKRISRGLTKSNSQHYNYVEEGLLSKLIKYAAQLYERELGTSIAIWGRIFLNDLRTYFKLPTYKRNFEEAKKDFDKVSLRMIEPERKHKIKLYYDDTQNSTYRLYGVEIKSCTSDLRWGRRPKDIYKNLQKIGVNAGKIHATSKGYFTNTDKLYIQVYVYDYIGS